MYERVLQKQPPEMLYKLFLEILQNSQEKTCARDSFLLFNTRSTEQLLATASGSESASF